MSESELEREFNKKHSDFIKKISATCGDDLNFEGDVLEGFGRAVLSGQCNNPEGEELRRTLVEVFGDLEF